VLEPNEILTEIRIPKPPARSGGAYLKLERKVGDFAIAGVAVMLALDEKGKVSAVGIGVTNAGPTAIRARKAEEILRGQATDDKTIAAAAAAAAGEFEAVVRSARSGRVQAGRGFACSRSARSARPSSAPREGSEMAVETAPTTSRGQRTLKIHVTINGAPHDVDVEARTLLVHFLRENLGMTGTHIGCDTTNCGACTVLLNGRAVKSCTVFAVQADQGTVATVEGLEKDGKLHPIQEGFHQEHGLAMRVLHSRNDDDRRRLARDEQEADRGWRSARPISGNLCRCTGYVNIVKSIDHAAARHGRDRGREGLRWLLTSAVSARASSAKKTRASSAGKGK